MSTIAFKVSRKNGAYVKPSLIPANHSAQPHFGRADAIILSLFLAMVAGLGYLLLHL